MRHEALLTLLRWLFAGLALAAIVAYVVRPLLRMVRSTPDAAFTVPDYSKLIEEEKELEIPTGDEAGFNRDETLAEARADPRATALRVQKWLKEKR